MKRTFNWRPDVPDVRDLIYRPKRMKLADLAAKVDLRKKCSAVEDQGALGSCTSNAIAGAIEVLERIRNKKLTEISRLFIYYNERAYINQVNNDSGAYIRDGIKSVHKIGAADEAIWPYEISRFTDRPSEAAYADAAARKFNSYFRVTSLPSMLACLNAGFPFVFGFSVYESFLTDTVAKTGVVNMPAFGEKMVGGHAVLAVGYNQATQRFLVRNSWGQNWGSAGYCTMPYTYLSDRNLSDDFWTLRS